MSKLLISAAAIAVIGTCSLSMPANAQGVDIQIGPNGVRPVIRDGCDRRRDACSPGEAMAAARDEGFRHPRIARVTDRSVTVEGMTADGPDRIRFANRPGCPEL